MPAAPWCVAALAAVAAEPFEVDPARTEPLSVRAPAAGTVVFDALQRTFQPDWSSELFGRGRVVVAVEVGRRGRRTLTTSVTQDALAAQTVFGLVDRAQLDAVAQASAAPAVVWTVDRRGQLVDVAPPAGASPSAGLTAAIARHGQFVTVPRRVRPGERWPVTQQLRLPVDVAGPDGPGVHGAVDLTASGEGTFAGWTEVDGRWLARVEVEVELTLAGALASDGYDVPVGAVARAASLVVLDPADGLPVWSMQRIRMHVAAGRSDRLPEPVDVLMRLERR